jgi:hypothetical protein
VRAVTCWTINRQVAEVSLHPVLQPAQPLALLQRCAPYSVVGDIHEESFAGAPNTDRSFRHAGVLRHIGKGFRNYKVGRLFDTGSEAFTVESVGNPDMNAAALSQCPERRPEAGLRQDGRVDSPGQVPKLAKRECQLLCRLF